MVRARKGNFAELRAGTTHGELVPKIAELFKNFHDVGRRKIGKALLSSPTPVYSVVVSFLGFGAVWGFILRLPYNAQRPILLEAGSS